MTASNITGRSLGTNTGPGGTGKPVRISGMENWKRWEPTA